MNLPQKRGFVTRFLLKEAFETTIILQRHSPYFIAADFLGSIWKMRWGSF
jgi:hypothetical protein